MKSTSPLAVVAVAVVLSLAVTASCRSRQAEACSDSAQCLPQVTFEGIIDQQRYEPDALHGHVVVVNFWATWCGPCKKEIPAFNQVYTRYREQGVAFLGVLNDNRVDDAGLLNFMSDHEMTYPVVKADSSVMSAFEFPDALPTTFIYDQKGKLVRRQRGPLDETELVAILDKLLAAQQQE